MDRVDGPGDAFQELGGGPRRERPILDPAAERSALQQFNRQVGNGDTIWPHEGIDLVNLHHLRMLDAGEDLGLEEEALNGARIRDHSGQDHLRRDQPIEAAMPGLVHHPHAAATDLTHDVETRNAGQAGRVRNQKRGVAGEDERSRFGE